MARASQLEDGDREASDAIASARAAGLRYVDDHRPGLRRRRAGRKLRQGRRWIDVFTIEDEAGHVVRDAETLERIRKLAIPPAWVAGYDCGQGCAVCDSKRGWTCAACPDASSAGAF